jgi:rSAM/selenodomain-associated transferase 2
VTATVSVVVPALDEAGRIGACVRSAREAGASEVIVVDGGSRDGTLAEAASAGADAAFGAPPGRASQMNAGAARASGDIFCFLHADSRLPAGACDAIRAALADPSVAGGAFRIALDLSPGASPLARLLLRLTATMAGVRAAALRSFTGDQAIFVRRTVFERIGGYERIPLMEDVRLSAAMRGAGKTVLLREKVATSARRWETGGPLRTIGLMWFLRAAHALGLSPGRCAALYRNR